MKHYFSKYSRIFIPAILILIALPIYIVAATPTRTQKSSTTKTTGNKNAEKSDTVSYVIAENGDTVLLAIDPSKRSGRLTEEDFKEVAAELGVEVAAIKAVVEIEAGRTHQGFWSENKPIINFDLAVFRKMAAKNKVSLSAAAKNHPVIFARPNVAKYGSQQAGQQARLDAARKVHDLSAIEGTFWGMFQIGGFNWKICGTSSPDEFVELMSRSERDQLELFAVFLKNTGLLQHLRNKNWAAFARGYNGNNYAARGYHTRLASAYAKYKKQG